MNLVHTPSDLVGLTLNELGQWSFSERRDAIAKRAGDRFEVTLEHLQASGFPSGSMIQPIHLASALAYNVAGQDAALSSGKTAPHGYAGRFPSDTSWNQVWAILIKPFGPSAADTPLSELACSVACEQRRDWTAADAPDLAMSYAHQAFDFVYRRDQSKVRGYIVQSFHSLGPDAASIANEAWSRVFCDYWSNQARRRFLGLSRISTLVSQIARFVAMDALRARTRDSSYNEFDPEHPQLVEALTRLEVSADPAKGLLQEDMLSRLRGCLSNLPGRQQLVAELAWFRELPAKEIARQLNISEPAVSQHLKKARLSLRTCLESSPA